MGKSKKEIAAEIALVEAEVRKLLGFPIVGKAEFLQSESRVNKWLIDGDHIGIMFCVEKKPQLTSFSSQLFTSLCRKSSPLYRGVTMPINPEGQIAISIPRSILEAAKAFSQRHVLGDLTKLIGSNSPAR